jgi:mono/diheme cytochrome c family protein
MSGYTEDPVLDRETNRWMMWGLYLMAALVLAFPLYRLIEPSSREDAREANLASLADEGASIWSFNCAACHGADGEGVSAPALNSQQFLAEATNEQIELLVSVGVPGTQMSAYALDHGGPLTSEQIRSVAVYLRSLEDDAPDRPDWRDVGGA